MINLKLTDEEAIILHNIVESFFENLRFEIMHTDRKEYREMLKQQEETVRKILDQMEKKAPKVPA